jgi:hypothetical protein
MPDNPVFLKLQCADKRLRELDSLLNAFSTHPQPIVIERDSQTNEILYRLATTPAIDSAIQLLAGDILQSLRSALDYLAWALVSANRGQPSIQTAFPITEKAPGTKGYDDAFAGKVRGMSKDAIGKIESTKPYKGGHSYLWPVHELNNREKHRLLFTVGAYVSNFSISQHIEATNPPLEIIERMARAYASDTTWVDIRKGTYPLKAGDVLLRDSPDRKPNHDAQFFIQVALDEKGVFEGEPLLAVIWQSFQSILSVITQFNGMY